MKRRILLVLLVLVLLAAGLLGYMQFRGNAPDEVAELVSQGGEKVLADPMKPARGAPRVIVFALDGVGDGELRRALAGGVMPRTAALLGRETAPRTYEHGWSATGVLSILPSTTYAAWASTFTGQPPARTGVPGNEWFAREEMRFYAPAPVSVTQHEHALQVYTDQLMSRVLRAPTVYERAGVRSYVSLQAFHRGADLLTVPAPESYGRMITEMAGGLTSDDESVSQEAYEELDRTAAESLVESIGRHGVADLQTVYFPGVDLYTHVAAHPLDDQVSYLGRVVDPAIGRILEAYRRAGALDGTWIVFVADHGHTPVLSDDHHTLGAEGDDEPPQVLRNLGFRMRPLELDVDSADADYQAAVAYQGAFAYVYLADRGTCPRPGTRCDWKRGPRMEQDVLPVARAFWEASRTGAGVPALRGTIDLVFARPPRPVGQDALPFQVFDGRRLVPVDEYLAAHPRPELRDLARRLDGLGAGPYGHHAGDVLLLARTGLHLPVEERFYFSSGYHSWHGSPTPQDSEIPLLVAHPGVAGGAIRARVRRAVGERPTQLSITPLILDLLRAEP
ncbi:alkaline phosphatase family protein [Longimicrobium sp.]|uniref:alkaline phosphatase family protein n=1 Tax=Longimicrobium sp. TaxID=2029185 RepID=UPI002E33C95A|nr:alkaline phosphatase family protein [Longimicrobium sp.]HEX6041271.1 alkaline phosphatase family protein [Longimicrobium sp.]